MNSRDRGIRVGSKRNLQRRQVDLRRQKLHLALHLLDPAAHVTEFLGDVERVFNRGCAFQYLQILRFFSLRVPKAGVKIDILAGHVANFDALPVDSADIRDDVVEARGGDANGHVSRISATIGVGGLFDVSAGSADDGPDLCDGLRNIAHH